MTNHLNKLLLLSFFCVLFASNSLLAQVHFSASVSPAIIGKNETTELKFTIENADQAANFIAPSLKDFIVLSGPNQESGMENNNGITKQYIGLSYILKPKTRGNFTIGPALVKVDGKFLKTNNIQLKVTNATAPANQGSSSSAFGGLSDFFDEPSVREPTNKDFILKEGENVQEKIAKNIFLKLITDKTSCYIGEPIVVTYKLYSRLKSESSITRNPYLNGFSVIDLIQAGTTAFDIEKINGREFNVYTLRKAQLYPLQSGNIEVEIAEVENTIHFIKESYLKSHGNSINDAIYGLPAEAMQDEKITLQSKPVIITVKPLPEINKPASFKGAVGNFKIEAAVEKNVFSTDEPGKLEVLVSGQGNMELINAPDVKFPDSIENFEPALKEALNKQAVPVSGQKRYTYSFTVKNPGRFTIPPIEYSFFDPQLGKYSTVSTIPIVFVVTKGTGKNTLVENKGSIKGNQEGIFTPVITREIWIIVAIIMMLLTCLFLLFKVKYKKRTGLTSDNLKDLLVKNNTVPAIEKINYDSILPVSNPLAATAEMLFKKDTRGFYEALNRELNAYISLLFNIPANAVNKDIIAEAAEKISLPLARQLQIVQLLEQVQWQLYTPFSEEGTMENDYQRAVEIVKTV